MCVCVCVCVLPVLSLIRFLSMTFSKQQSGINLLPLHNFANNKNTSSVGGELGEGVKSILLTPVAIGPHYTKTCLRAYTYSECPDQPAHPCSLIKVFNVR